MRVERGRRYELRHNTNATALICAAGLLFPAYCRLSGCQQVVSLSCALSLWAMHRRLFRCVSKVYRLAFRPAFTDGCDPASLSLLAF